MALLLFGLGLNATTALAANGTLIFASNSGISGDVAQDGQGGSTDLAGITLQIHNITDTAGTTGGAVTWLDNSWLSSSDGSYSGLTYDDFLNGVRKGMSIKSSDGSEFQINSFKYYNWGEVSTTTITVKGYRDGAEVSSTSFEGYNSGFNPQTVSLDSSFDNVDQVRLYISAGGDLGDQSGSYHSINNIVIADAVTPAPTITSATYNTSSSVLTVSGTDFTSTGGAMNDVIANKFTLTAEGGSTYTLTDTPNVEITSSTHFVLTLSGADSAAVNLIINKNGTSSTDGTSYNLAGAAGFIADAPSDVDLTANAITASNVPVPSISYANYDASTGVLSVTGTGFSKRAGGINDILANKFTLYGEGANSYTLTDTSNVEITSNTSFALTLSATDKEAYNLIANKNGGVSTDISTFYLDAADDWAAGADPAIDIEDSSGNNITVSNVAIPTITSSTYNFSTGVLVVTGNGYLSRQGATNDVVANKFTFTGQGGATYTYTLTDTANVDVSSSSSFTMTLSATDKTAVNSLLNNNGTSAQDSATYNLAAADNWAAGANAAIDVADLTGNGITASNVMTVPGAPTIGTATAGDTQASVTFSAPGSNGGSAINAYTVTSSPGGYTGSGAGSPLTVTGLTNGVAYTFTVKAINSSGVSSASSASNSVTPQASQTITFNNPGAQNFGTNPTLSASSTSGLTPTFTSSTTGVCTISTGGALNFVTAGTCSIDANEAGNGSYLPAATVARSFIVNAVVPGAPTAASATVGDTQASVSFTPPVSNGGVAITGYTVTSSPGGFTGTGAGSPITVTGLTNGVAYTFTVTATNSAGTSSASGSSSVVTPKAVQTISFANPGAQSFGTTPTLSATASSGLTPAFTSSTTDVCTISTGGDLSFVTIGTCTISADEAGNSSYSSAAQVSQSFSVNAVVAGAPTIGTATAGDTQASVSFTAPTSTGGAAITAYTLTSSPGGFTASGAGSPLTVLGLTNGSEYSFSVTATNSAGTGLASSASNSVTPMAAQIITFSNPGSQSFGTTPTLSASSTSGLTPTFTSSTTGVCSITSGGALSFVTSGTCTISADQAGNAAYSAAAQVSQSFSVNAVVAGSPTIGSATAGDTQASVSFTAPANNGGAAITAYNVTSSPGGLTASGTSSPLTVAGLTNGTAYTFSVTATNSAGTGSSSSASNSVTPIGSQTITFTNPGAQNIGTTPTLTASASSGLTPSFTSSTIGVCTISSGGALSFVTTGSCTINADQAGNAAYSAAVQVSQTFDVNAVVAGAPVIGSATAGDAQASVMFSAPTNNGGSAITDYTVTSSPGGLTASGTSSPLTVVGLTNGTAYTFSVTATNSAGTGSSSSASNSVTPIGSQTITFTNPGAQNIGTTPTLTASASSGLTPSFTSSTIGVCTISSGGALSFITTGSCTINADQAGNAAYSAAVQVSQTFDVNAVVAGAPVIGSATAGDAQASVSFTAPANNGGAAITAYTVTSSPGGFTASGTGSPLTVAGLTNGTAYTFSVTATNSAGTSGSSSTSNSVTPIGSQTITFTNPGAQNIGTTPTLTASASSGLTPSFTSSTIGVCTISSGGALSFVTTGSCTINADQAGNAAYSAAAQVSQTFDVNAVVAGAPVIGSATAGDAQASVMFSAPANNGGSAITDYSVTSSPGGLTASGTSSPLTVAGLTNGTAYTFSVTATNSAGISGSSSASNSVTPIGSQTITFTNPGAQNIGTTPTLTASASSGLTPSFTSSTIGVCTISSGGALSFVTTGSCTINADQAGNAAYSAAAQVSQTFDVNAVVAGAPVIGSATAGDAQASVMFSAPANNGGSAITDYTVTSSPGGLTASGTSSPLTVAGLTNGTAYTFSVTATNSAGISGSSSASNSVTPIGLQTITFTNPGAQNIGTSPTLTASASSGLTPSFSSATIGVCTISSGGALSFITTGSCTINADQAGNAAYSAAVQVSQTFDVNAVVAGAPVIGSATAGDAQASVMFSAPANNGGSAITDYTVTSSPGGLTASGTSSPLTVVGLTNGTAYTFSVTATNSAGISGSSSASNSVTPSGAPIFTSTPLQSVNQNEAYNYTPVASDTAEDVLTYSALTLPAWLSFDDTTTSLTGVPSRDDVGSHSISLKVVDARGLFDIQSFTLVVNAVNSIPVADNANVTLDEDTSLSIIFTATDDDGDVLTYEVVTQPTSGTFDKHGSAWLYTPNADFNGDDSVSFIAKDAESSSEPAVVIITVNPLNDEPVAVDDNYSLSLSADSSYIMAVLDNDTDVDGDTLTIDGAAADVGSVQIVGSQLNYQAPTDFVGPVALRYTISDGQKGRSHAKVQLIITGENSADAPVITVPADITANATGLFTKLKLGVATAVDKEGNKLAVSLVNTQQLFAPGEHLAYWQATDSEGLSSIKSQKVTVNPLISISQNQLVAEGSEVQFSLTCSPP
ncbi:fibronectin type III domain-containing protein [Shewanella ulleungensis]|uniref:fibronectin type III domain-containing protein n=1 Tax=Shewanella ulleungensis TaxID=2282699 RepID=UPI003D7B3B47